MPYTRHLCTKSGAFRVYFFFWGCAISPALAGSIRSAIGLFRPPRRAQYALFARLLAMPIRRAFPGRSIAPTRTLRSNAYAQTDAGSTQPFSLARSINFHNCLHCTSLGCRVIEAFSINDIYFSSFGIKMRSRFANSRNDCQ